MGSLPTKYPAGRSSTAGMASDMVGPRWKRRSFVDDGIPPNKIPCWSKFHRWNGLRHGWATMETDILRGRWNPLNKIPCRSGVHRWNGLRHGWSTMETKILRGRLNPSRQSTLPVGAPPLDWPPTWLGDDGNEDHSWTMESPRQNILPVEVPPLEWPPTWSGHDGNEDPSWTMGSLPTKYPAGRRFHRCNGLRHGWPTMETKIIRGRWDPSRQAKKHPRSALLEEGGWAR